MDLPPPAHLHLTTHLHPTILGWVALLTLLRLGVLLQVATTTIGQAVLLQEDIITHLAVLRLAELTPLRLPVLLLQVATTTIVQAVLLQEVIPTTHPVVPRPADLTLIQPAVIRQADTITLQLLQQSMAESQSLSG